MKKSLMTFLLLFNDLMFGKSSLFCCNGYRHVISTILFYESQVEYLRKHLQKKKKYCWFIHFICKLPKLNKSLLSNRMVLN